jgi:hypothetical protein
LVVPGRYTVEGAVPLHERGVCFKEWEEVHSDFKIVLDEKDAWRLVAVQKELQQQLVVLSDETVGANAA